MRHTSLRVTLFITALFFFTIYSFCSPYQQNSRTSAAQASSAQSAGISVRSLDFKTQSAVVLDQSGKEVKVSQNQPVGPWTLMAVVQDQQRQLAVFEQVQQHAGDIL